MKPLLIFIAGPTAVGKTAVAIALAKKLKSEIISFDSMQVYKRMDIITSKPDKAERSKIRHHLIDMILPSSEYDVSRYRRQALQKIKGLTAKGKAAILTGGTGLYMTILVDGIFKFNAKDKKIRERLYKLGLKYGNAYLYNRLKKADPLSAAKIHPNDTKRAVRALEVFEAAGKPISELQKERQGLSKDYRIRIFCLDLDRNLLYKRINERVEKMFRIGLIGEVKKLLKLKLSRTARVAIGLKELKGYFDKEYDLEQSKELIKRNTRQYAKRQLTWFRKDKRIEWIKAERKDKPESLANKIWKKLS